MARLSLSSRASLRGLHSHQTPIRGLLSIYLLSSTFSPLSPMSFPLPPPVPCSPPRRLSLPSDQPSSARSFDFKPPYRTDPYTLSSLPCRHSCIQLHGPALMHFVRNARTSLFVLAETECLLSMLSGKLRPSARRCKVPRGSARLCGDLQESVEMWKERFEMEVCLTDLENRRA